MKQIILSADGECGLYLVPDDVVDNLPKYLTDFREWMINAPEASKYRQEEECLCFTEADFMLANTSRLKLKLQTTKIYTTTPLTNLRMVGMRDARMQHLL